MTNDKNIFFQWYVNKQINNFFPSKNNNSIDNYSIKYALDRTNNCISKIKSIEKTEFNYLNSGQYATFLYFLSKYIYDCGNKELATKIFLLNKSLNGIDLFYEVNFPEYFIIGHTVGMVFSKAQYSNYCVFHQGCTVGRNLDDRPILGEGVVMYPGSMIIGKCEIKPNTVVTPGVKIVNKNSPGNCYVFQKDNGDLIYKNINEIFYKRYFSD